MIEFSKKLLKWFAVNKRDLPWRSNNIPYNIWVSEIILQQTRVNQGTSYYLRFIEEFPNVKALANAKQEDVLKLWQGLGYYSRARNLHKGAAYIVNELNGIFPNRYMDIIRIPGVGPYTAAAIASIAFNESVPAIDGNAKRVFARIFNISDPIDQNKTIQLITNNVHEIIDRNAPGDFNQAVMELGATVCQPKNPQCEKCPVMLFCEAKNNNSQYLLPVKARKVKMRKRYFYYFVFDYNNNTCLIERTGDDIWKGLYEFPLFESDLEIDGNEIVNIAEKQWGVKPNIVRNMRISKQFKHVLTHQQIFATFIIIDLNAIPKKIKLDTNLKMIQTKPVSRLTEIFLTKDEKFI